MNRFDIWDLHYRPGGWVRAEEPGLGLRVYLRVRFEGDRPDVQCAAMVSRERISARLWRHVPLDRVERDAMTPAIRGILTTEDATAPTLDALESYFDVDPARDAGRPTESLHTKAAREPVFLEADDPLHALYSLLAPEKPIPDDFYVQLAAAYKLIVSVDEAPAPMIAAQTNVSVRTVHGWVSEARKRGYLPPAKKGKAG